MNATPKQLWALWLATGKTLELRGMQLDFEVAKSMISRLKSGQTSPDEMRQELLDFGADSKGGPIKVKQTTDWEELYRKADAAGKAAAAKKVPTPMIVVDGNGREYPPVMGGVCGFAEVKFPGNTAWARWCRDKGLAKPAYNGGYYIWISDYGQSMELKEAYANAFAQVLKEAGLERVYAQSRMD